MLEKIWCISLEGFARPGLLVRRNADGTGDLAVFLYTEDPEFEIWGASLRVADCPFNEFGKPGTFHLDGPGSVVYRDHPESDGSVIIDRSDPAMPRFYDANKAEPVSKLFMKPIGIWSQRIEDSNFVRGGAFPIGQPAPISESQSAAKIAETEQGETGSNQQSEESASDKSDESPQEEQQSEATAQGEG